MNTTPTRMVYDRLTRQQQLSIAVASATDIHPQKDRKAEKEIAPTASPSIYPTIFIVAGGVVALFTRNAVRRGGVLSPEERRVLIHP